MKLRIVHRTEYHYQLDVTQNQNEIRVRPMDRPCQTCDFFVLKVTPSVRLRKYNDLFGNRVHYIDVPEPHRSLVIEATSTVRTDRKVDFNAFPYGFSHDRLDECKRLEHCHDFLQDSSYVGITPEIWRGAIDIRDRSDDVFQTSYAVMEYIYNNFDYVPGATAVTTRAAEVFAHRRGVCQDFAHMMLAFLRALGIPARYISGYLFDPSRTHMRGAHASHAWVEVYIHGHGWFGFDPTNNRVCDEHYVVTASGRDYEDVAPIKGSFYGGGHHSMLVTVDVTDRSAAVA